eukprot:TRINITY_DN19467_c0_g1_i1.p1 TRINITY_DN19467_c0_g1~~TRINITY_DN19467_c0_g1_i1.p1  ORF type:complete len:203 (+),score=71.93 TRINITY_DN19467_c0_g1_i1:104-712(+)
MCIRDREGLWRKAGNKAHTAALIAQTQLLGRFPLEDITECHNLTSMLVQLLQQLPGGLIGGPQVQALIAEHSAGAAPDTYLQVLQSTLTPGKMELLTVLLQHWQAVIAADNRMDVDAMVTCVFAVVAPDLPSYVQHMAAVMEIVKHLLSTDPGILVVREQMTSPIRAASQTADNVVREACLLYTSDAADEEDSVDLGGRGII